MSSSEDEVRPSRASQMLSRTQKQTLSQKSKSSQRVAGSQHLSTQVSSSADMEESSSTQPPLVTQGSGSLKIRNLARHLLHASSNEKDGALRDAVAQKMHMLSRREYCYALREASAVLKRCFGCKVIHRNNQSYIVRQERIEGNYPEDTLAQAKRGLLSSILMFIFVSKSKKLNVTCISETMLLNFLSGLGLCYDKPDPVFGDIKKLISPSHAAEFVQAGYITFAKSIDRSETQMFTYDWGPRALLICEPKVILKSFCTIVKDEDVELWTDQLETAKLYEKEAEEVLKNSEQYMQEER